MPQLAERFSVSLGWAKKISAQRRRTGKAERTPHRPGRKLRTGPEAQQQVRMWAAAQPDLTLAEIQARLKSEAGVAISVPQVWFLLRRLGLRLKKSRSTPPNAIAQPTSGSAKSISPGSARSRLKS